MRGFAFRGIAREAGDCETVYNEKVDGCFSWLASWWRRVMEKWHMLEHASVKTSLWVMVPGRRSETAVLLAHA